MTYFQPEIWANYNFLYPKYFSQMNYNSEFTTKDIFHVFVKRHDLMIE